MKLRTSNLLVAVLGGSLVASVPAHADEAPPLADYIPPAFIGERPSLPASMDAATASKLTLVEAIQIATQNNLSLRLRKEQLAATRGEIRAEDDARAAQLAERTEAQLAALARSVGESLATSLDAVVKSAQAAPEAAAKVIDDAAERLRAQTEADSARDARIVEVLGKLEELVTTIDLQREAQDARLASLEGKLDSGADICALPESVIAALDLPPVREVRAAGFTGELRPTLLYRCTLDVAGRRFQNVEALATSRHYAIVGRNVLCHLVVKLDGPNEQLSLAHPSARRRRGRSGKTKARR